MKAIILSAGQGRRLLPLTEEQPKCLLPVDGDKPILEVQLRTLARGGVRRAVVMVGFGAEQVERFVRGRRADGMEVRTCFNPFYAVSDNLATCWLARPEMSEDFLVINGDTLFESAALGRVLSAPKVPVTVTIDSKIDYDADDMKVSLREDGRLRAIGKKLPPDEVDGESIGLLAFRGSGAQAFREALDQASRQPEALRAWYLAVIDRLASKVPVETVSIKGLWWAEIDSPDDLARVREAYHQRIHGHRHRRLAAIRSAG